MHFGVIGINCKNSDLELREEFAKACSLAKRLGVFSSEVQIVLLLTCNRCEIYFEGALLHEIHNELIQRIRAYLGCCFEQKLYTFFAEECLHHLALVATGLDSRIIGETEIRRQVKDAYRQASSQETLGIGIHFLFQRAFQISKKIRSDYPKLVCYQTLEETVVAIVVQMLPNKQPPAVLLYGKSETNRKIAHLLKKKMQVELTLCSRFGACQEGWPAEVAFCEESKLSWQDYDCVIAASKRSSLVLEENTLLERANLLIDLSVPRVIDPRFKEHPQVNLLNIDDVLSLADLEKKRFEDSLAKIQTQIWTLAKRHVQAYQKKLEFSMARIAGEGTHITNVF